MPLTQPSGTYTLITGASEGIGAVLATELAAQGHNLILVARTTSKLENVRQKAVDSASRGAGGSASGAGKKGIQVQIVTQDLSESDASQKVFDACRDYPVSYLINNAGQAIGGHWEGHSVERLQRCLALNISALTELTSLFLPSIKKYEGGLLNVGSMSAFMPIPYMAIYAASKAYVLSFSEALHVEMLQLGHKVRVCCLCPGPTSSEIWSKNGASSSSVILTFSTPEQVAQAGLRGLQRNSASVVPGLFNNVLLLGVRIAPRALTTRLSAWLMGQHAGGDAADAQLSKSKGEDIQSIETDE